MAKKGGRRLSGNPARAVAQMRDREIRTVDALQTAALARQLEAVPNPTEADWHRLEEKLRGAYPNCPDCGAIMQGDPTESGEEGGDDEGNMVISMSLICTVWDDADEAGDEPPPHPVTDGFVYGELTLHPSG